MVARPMVPALAQVPAAIAFAVMLCAPAAAKADGDEKSNAQMLAAEAFSSLKNPLVPVPALTRSSK